jgi:hypothetical protein
MRWLAIAVAGAVVCTVCDHLHVMTGVLSYPRPAFFGEAWWVPLLFAAASVVIVDGARVVRKALRGPLLPVPSGLRIAAGGVGFVTAYAFTAYGHDRPGLVLWVLIGFWLARAPTVPRWVLAYSIVVAIGGSSFEGFWSRLGFFRYHAPDLWGVPRWLPGIYLHVAFLTADLGRLVARDQGQPRVSTSISTTAT